VAGNSILLAKKGMRFDVREIALGYALDLAAAKLAEKGVRSAVISTPTVCRTMGDPPDKRGFKLTFANPASNDTSWATVWAPVGGVAFASVRDGKFTAGGKSYHQHLDPRNGMPANQCAGALVQSADAATAQAMAYSVFVLGGTDGLDKDGKAAVGGSAIMRDGGGKMQITMTGSLADHVDAK
jgi:thiamine biosynthesis lipoprotein ApbE